MVPDRYGRQAKRLITGGREVERVVLISFERLALRYPQLSWVLYSQAARAISIG